MCVWCGAVPIPLCLGSRACLSKSQRLHMAELQQTTGLATLSEEAGGGAPRVQVGAMSARIAKSGRTPNARPSVNISSLGSERTMMKLYDTNNDGQIDEDELKVMARDSMRINKTNRWLYRVEFVLATALLLLAMSNFGTTYVAEVWADEATRQMNVVEDASGQYVLSPKRTAGSGGQRRRLQGKISPEETCPEACTGNPTETCFHDPTGCMGGVDTLGCNAGGHTNCRFCGFGPFRKCPVPKIAIAAATDKYDFNAGLLAMDLSGIHLAAYTYMTGTPLHTVEAHAMITSWKLVQGAWLAVHLEDGVTGVVYANNSTETHGPATGMVFFDGQGTAHVTGAARNSSEFDNSELYFSDLAARACDDLGCPLTSCIAGTVDMIVRQVTCNGLRLWEWPGDNPIPDNSTTVSHARRLCVQTCKATTGKTGAGCALYCAGAAVTKGWHAVKSVLT